MDINRLVEVVDLFVGNSDMINLNEIDAVARTKFGAGFSHKAVNAIVSETENFELVQLKMPDTMELVWFLWDKRRENHALKRRSVSTGGMARSTRTTPIPAQRTRLPGSLPDIISELQNPSSGPITHS